MDWFLPYYVNFDLNLPQEYETTLYLFFKLIPVPIIWTDIQYTQFDLDV